MLSGTRSVSAIGSKCSAPALSRLIACGGSITGEAPFVVSCAMSSRQYEGAGGMSKLLLRRLLLVNVSLVLSRSWKVLEC